MVYEASAHSGGPARWTSVDLRDDDGTGGVTDSRRLYLQKSGLDGDREERGGQRVALLHPRPREQTGHTGSSSVAERRRLVVEEPHKREKSRVEILHRTQDATTRHRVVRIAAVSCHDVPIRVLLKQRAYSMDHCLRAAANADAELHRAQSLRPPRPALCRNRPCNDSTPDRAHRDGTDAARWLSEGHQPRGPKNCP